MSSLNSEIVSVIVILTAIVLIAKLLSKYRPWTIKLGKEYVFRILLADDSTNVININGDKIYSLSSNYILFGKNRFAKDQLLFVCQASDLEMKAFRKNNNQVTMVNFVNNYNELRMCTGNFWDHFLTYISLKIKDIEKMNPLATPSLIIELGVVNNKVRDNILSDLTWVENRQGQSLYHIQSIGQVSRCAAEAPRS